MFLPLLYSLFAEAPPVTEGALQSGEPAEGQSTAVTASEPASSTNPPPEQTPQQDGAITDTVQLTKTEYDNLINTNANLRNMQSSYDQLTTQVPVIQQELEALRKSKAELDVIKQQQEQIPSKTALDNYFDTLPQTGDGDDDESFLSSSNGDGLAQQQRFGEALVTTVIDAVMPELQKRDQQIEQVSTAQNTFQQEQVQSQQLQQATQNIKATMDAYTRELISEYGIDEKMADEYRASLENEQLLWDGVRNGTHQYEDVIRARHENNKRVLEFNEHKTKAEHEAKLNESRTASLASAGAKPVVIPDLSKPTESGLTAKLEGESDREYIARVAKQNITNRLQEQRLYK